MHSGIVLLDKPRGLSSNAALQRVRTLFGRVKAGHVGSLDPLATGMLPICLGEATKIAGEILAGRKRYHFTVALGSATATGDAEGEVTGSQPVPSLTGAAIEAALNGLRGRQRQIPPMYSALKRDGQPLYRLARAGVSVSRAAREIELFELTLCDFDAATLSCETLCSKGTYVRVLAEDLAGALGTCGHVSQLRRLYVEPFADEPLHTLESLATLKDAAVLPIDRPLKHLPAVRLSEEAERRLCHGQSVAAEAPAGRVRIYAESGSFLGLGEADGQGMVQPRRLISAATAAQ